MGIRKVLGASRWTLFYQLVKGFFLLILIAVVIALPLAWFSMVEPLCFPHRFESMVLYYACIANVVYLIYNSSFPDHKDNNEQTCPLFTI